MSENKKKPETTVETLDLGQNCLLTLTTRHLRGQVLRLVGEPGQPRRKIKEQVDVLLSGISGYHVEELNMKFVRIGVCIGGIIAAIVGLFLGTSCGDIALIGEILSGFGWILLPTGVLLAVLSFWFPQDSAVFTINVMGSKIEIPVVAKHVSVCRNFINRMQEAKTEYEEASL